jgi:hypothetical protein
VSTAKEHKRRKNSRKNTDPGVVRLELKDGMGRSRWITADLVDRTENGIGITLISPLKAGLTIPVRGKLGADHTDILVSTGVKWCLETSSGAYRAGLEFLDRDHTRDQTSEHAAPHAEPAQPAAPEDIDHYEAMQLNPNADPDTITRVYRILAQRYHPDNLETGNPELFVRLLDAYNTLNDPIRRAAYDVRHRQTKQLHWKIFDQPSAALGREAEKRKRSGILALLYAKTLLDPEHAAIGIHELEQLLGCPREHLETALWYLRAKGYIVRADNGRYSITIQGFDEAELQAADAPAPHAQIPAHTA